MVNALVRRFLRADTLVRSSVAEPTIPSRFDIAQYSPAPLQRQVLHPHIERIVDQAMDKVRFIEEIRREFGYSVSLEVDFVLKMVGIEPFTSASVDKYMWSEATKFVTSQLGTRQAYGDGYSHRYERWDNYRTELRTQAWKAIPIADYQERIPEEVLEVALRIRSLLADSKFAVVTFKPETIPVPINLDPFLRLDYKDHEYYVAVWDEPGFNDKLVK